MLNNNSVKAGILLAETLADLKANVSVLDGSPLVQLVADAKPKIELVSDDESLEANIAIATSSIKGVDEVELQEDDSIPSRFDLGSDVYVDQLTNKLTEAVRHCITVVVPKVIAFRDSFERLSEGKLEMKPVEESFDIKFLSIPDFIKTDFFTEQFDSLNNDLVYDKVKLDNVEEYIESLSDESFIDLFNTGISYADEEIQSDVLSKYSVTDLRNIVLSSTKTFSDYLNNFGHNGEGEPSITDVAVINILFYRGLEVRALQEGESNPTDIAKITDVRKYWLYDLKKVLDSHDRLVDNDTLVFNRGTSDELDGTANIDPYSDTAYPVTVVQESFENYVRKGGNINSLLGKLMRGTQYKAVSQESFNVELQTDLSVWKSRKAIITTESINSAFTDVKQRIIKAYQESQVSEGGDLYIDGETDSDVLNEAFQQKVENLNPDSFGEPIDLAIEFVGGVRYANFDCAEILKVFVEGNDLIFTEEKYRLVIVGLVASFLIENLDISSIV